MRTSFPNLLTLSKRLSDTLRVIGWQILIAFLAVLFFDVTVLVPSAQAATLNWNDAAINWTSGTAIPGANQNLPPAGGIGASGVRVNLAFTGDNIITILDDPPLAGGTPNVSGGATPTSTLVLLIDGAADTNSVTATFSYQDPAGNPVPVENARFVVLDVDTSEAASATPDLRLWHDQVIAGGTVAPTLQATTGPIAGLIPAIFPQANPNFYTPEFVAVPAPNTMQGRQLPGNGDQGNPWTASNQGSNGSVVVDYTDAITQATFEYGYGPLAQANPAQQGIGFFNVFFDPVAIGTAKQATTILDNGDGTFTITYRVIVENMGGVQLNSVQLTEDLTNTFVAPVTTFSVTDIRLVGGTRTGTPAPNINPGFTGVPPNTNLLDGAGSLLPRELNAANAIVNPGGTTTIEFDVRVTPTTFFGPFDNQVQASGTSPGNTTVTDDSVDGADTDPNGNGSATDDASPTQVTLPNTTSTLRLVKRITAVFRGGTELQRFNTFTDQAGTTVDNDLNAAFPVALQPNEPAGVAQVPASVGLQNGDQLEYSLYYWNPGATDLTDVSLCDEVEAPTTLVTTAALRQRSNPIVGPTTTAPTYVTSATVQAQAGGSVLLPACLSAPGNFPAGGGVTVPNFTLPAGQYGSIRFRVNIP
jgi:hypothetical protein